MAIGKTGKEQTKLELLESYRYFVADFESSEAMVERWKGKLENMAGSQGAYEMFSGGMLPADRVGEYVALWEDIVGRYLEHMAQLKAKIAECERICDELPPKYGTLIRMRYIDLMNWEDVAKLVGYSIQRVYQLRDEACKRLE